MFRRIKRKRKEFATIGKETIQIIRKWRWKGKNELMKGKRKRENEIVLIFWWLDKLLKFADHFNLGKQSAKNNYEWMEIINLRNKEIIKKGNWFKIEVSFLLYSIVNIYHYHLTLCEFFTPVAADDFHLSQNNINSSHFSWTLFSILTDLSSTMIQMLSFLRFPIFFPSSFRIIPRALFMVSLSPSHSIVFFSSLEMSWYFSSFSISFTLILWAFCLHIDKFSSFC